MRSAHLWGGAVKEDRWAQQAFELHSQDRLAQAERIYLRILSKSPRHWPALHNLGSIYKSTGRLALAEVTLAKALQVSPNSAESRYQYGLALLGQGRYAEGLPYFESRFDLAQGGSRKPVLPFPEWRGEDPADKSILIFPEQGLGDQLQAARFAPELVRRGADVTLLCAPPLHSILNRSFAATGVRVVPGAGKVEFPDPDYWCMSDSLAGLLGVTPETALGAPYLQADPRSAGHADRRIGFAWRGNPNNPNDRHRSLPEDMAQALIASTPGLFSLHPEDTGAKDFLETAEIIRGTTLTISVDTSIAHLSGALGHPTFVLLPYLHTAWRWMRDVDTSFWYPSATLFRQAPDSEWGPVLTAVSRTLQANSSARALEVVEAG